MTIEERSQIADQIAELDSNQIEDHLPQIVEAINKETLKIIEYLWVNNLISNNHFGDPDLNAIAE